MDPITAAIIAGITVGAGSGVSEVGKKALVDAYEGLKALLRAKFRQRTELAEALQKLEQKPGSEGRRKTLGEELAAAGASNDSELLEAARAVLARIAAEPAGERHVQAAVGVGIAQADNGGVATVNMSSPAGRVSGQA